MVLIRVASSRRCVSNVFLKFLLDIELLYSKAANPIKGSMIDTTAITGRFAPSPTGALHTGSLAAAVGSWLMAKSAGGRWLLRMDDLDTSRQVPGMADDILRTLEDFGLAWDGEIAWQSRHRDDYRQAFELLQQQGLVYPCGCSRREIA